MQDDFVALMPGGIVRTTEAGCFAKTYGLDPDDEPTIYGGTTRPDAWLENVWVAEDGKVDFFDTSHTANGRSTFPMANIRHRKPTDTPPAAYLLILNRSDHIIPAVAKLTKPRSLGTSCWERQKEHQPAGVAEAGKSLRVPGTNPFFFDDDSLQGNRLLELLETMPDLEAYVLNTGRIGGEDDRSKKVEISDSSAIVEGIVRGGIEWVRDPDFGYDVRRRLLGVDDSDLLQPVNFYVREGREAEYREMVERLRSERVGLSPQLHRDERSGAFRVERLSQANSGAGKITTRHPFSRVHIYDGRLHHVAHTPRRSVQQCVVDQLPGQATSCDAFRGPTDGEQADRRADISVKETSAADHMNSTTL